VGDTAAARLQVSVGRLARRARLRRGLQGGTRGLFYGLVTALFIAAASGSVSLPRPILLAVAAAGAGTLIGAGAGLLRRIDRRRMLFEADRLLGSRELLGTGHELVSTGASVGLPPGAATGAGGTFAQAVVEDAAGLLSRSPARRALGPLPLRLAPFLPLIAALVVAAFLFPLDIWSLLARRGSQAEIASIGEDLRGLGERLESSSRAQDLGRRLELSQQLAQLGRDLADHRITSDDALDRIQSLQDRVEREYELQVQRAPGSPGTRSGAGPNGRGTAGAPGASGGPGAGSPGLDSSAADGNGAAGDTGGSDADSQALADTLDRLRQAQDLLKNGDQAAAGGSGQRSAGRSGSAGQGSSPRGSSRRSPGSAAGNGAPGQAGNADLGGAGGGNGSDQGGGADGTGPTGSAPGSTPAPDKTGPPTTIARGGPGSAERAQGTVGEGDSTSFLVRALPEWTGSHLPEETVRRGYAKAAEAALLRDEVPPDLKASVRDYFTDIGMSAGSQGQGSGGQ
jgi:hypothetical protein